MDTNAYAAMFLAESREHLQELNLAVVRIEEQPDDRETLDEIFRIAHSFKGMSAAMGYANVAALTHKMEDVFELLRQRRDGISRDAIDVLLECLDAISETVDAIEAEGADALDAAALITRLDSLVRERTPDQAYERAHEPVDEAAPLPTGPLTHVTVKLADDAAMRAVRAFMVVNTLEEQGDIARAVPAEDALDAFDGDTVEVWLVGEPDAEALAAAVRSVPDVVGVECAVVGGGTTDDGRRTTGTTEGSTGRRAHKGGQNATVRVDAARLDQLMHFMGELVVHRTKVESLAQGAEVPGLDAAMQELTRSSQALQAMVMQVRMIPVDAVFMRFPRLVRDLGSKLGKKVELNLVGGDTELDRTVVDALGDPLVHLIRNSLDHGLEPPADRVAAGKPEQGTVTIAARHAGGNVVIEVCDDGRGIDPERVAAKAAERGLITPDQVPLVDAARAAELLFAAGFSTAETTSDVSGRGVGMDAVRATIRDLGGDVALRSVRGEGTTAEIRLPLTLAIMSALLVEAAGLPYAIQLDRVETILRLEDHPVRSVTGRKMLVHGDDVMPLLKGVDALSAGRGRQGANAEDEHAIVVQTRDGKVGLSVTRLVGQRELVTRALPPQLSETTAVSGGAVLSDGDIALIVDCDALGVATA